MKIGYIGLGDMGGALARRLQSKHQIMVYDRSKDAVNDLALAGATPCATATELGSSSEVVMLCLPTSEHVHDLLFNTGLAKTLRPGSIVVDQTSGDPSATRKMAAELNDLGVEFIDAPVSGGPRGAEAGTIAIMVGASAEQLARVQPIFEMISPNVFHTGEVGTGHTMKLVNNLISCAQRLLSLEGLALAAKNGIEPAKAVAVLRAGGARNAFLERRAAEVIAGSLDAGFSLGLAHKDLRLACQLGAESGMPLFYGAVTRELYQLCINDLGVNSKVDTAALAMDRLTGADLVPPRLTVE